MIPELSDYYSTKGFSHVVKTGHDMSFLILLRLCNLHCVGIISFIAETKFLGGNYLNDEGEVRAHCLNMEDIIHEDFEANAGGNKVK